MFAKAALLVALAMGSAVAHAGSDDFVNFAFVSASIGVSPSRLCFGEPNPTSTNNIALGCPSYAPSLTTGGDVSVTGNLSASKFIGDGSGLTGLSTSTDRIISNTTSVITNSDTASISFTVGGVAAAAIISNGNVGIGITNPSFKVDVNGALRASSQIVTPLVYTDSVYSMGSGFMRILAYSADLILGANNVEKMRIATSGNVGIATQSPTATLQVSGSLIVSTSAQTTTPTLYVGTNGNVGVGTNSPVSKFHSFVLSGGIPSLSSDVTSAAVFQASTAQLGFGVHSNSPYGFWLQTKDSANSGVSYPLLLNPVGGNVGIGTTAPTATLQVSGSLIVSTTATSAASPSFYVNSSGNVGFGAIPGSKFVVESTGPITRDIEISPSYITFGYNYLPSDGYALRLNRSSGQVLLGSSNLKFTNSGAATWPSAPTALAINSGNATLIGQGWDGANNFHTFGYGTTSFIGFNGSGKAGINTAVPSATLHVVGTVSVSSNVSVTGNVSANKFIGDGSGLTNLVAGAVDRISTSGVASGGTLGMAVASYGTVSFTTGGVEGTSYLDTTGRWVGPGISVTTLNGISSTNGYFSGNVGVGTNAPGAPLDVVGYVRSSSATAPASRYSRMGFGELYTFYQGGYSSRFVFDAGEFTVYGMNADTTPGVRLNGSSGLIEANTLQSASGGIGLAGSTYSQLKLSSGYWGVSTVTPATVFNVFNSSGALTRSRIQLYNGDAGAVVLQPTAGNVGIGTTAPASTLDVSGTARIVSEVAIGMNATPSATLDVSGTVKVAGTGSETCGPNNYGAIRRNPTTGAIQICVHRP